MELITTICLVLSCIIDWAGAYKDYSGFKLLSITPENEGQLKFLATLWRHERNYDLDFWKSAKYVGESADVMVPPLRVKSVEKLLNETGIPYDVKIDNIQEEIDHEQKPDHDQVVTKRSIGRYNVARFNSLDQINEHMIDLERENSFAERIWFGWTSEGREMYGLKLSTRSGNKGIFLDGGFHAREWISQAVVLYIMDMLVAGYNNKDPYYVNLLENADFYLLPVANPDGYDYSVRSDRMWRRTRSGPHCGCFKSPFGHFGTACEKQCCFGVDMNRNFGFKYGEGGNRGSSSQPCTEDYRGPQAWSEVEARNIRDFITPKVRDISAYITFHSYGQYWFVPYGYRAGEFPRDYTALKAIADDGAYAIQRVHQTRYKVGSSASFLYPTAGTSDDWAKSIGIKYVYCFELRPDDFSNKGFLVSNEVIRPTGEETLEGLKLVFNKVADISRKTNSRHGSVAANTVQSRSFRQRSRGSASNSRHSQAGREGRAQVKQVSTPKKNHGWIWDDARKTYVWTGWKSE